ncbi:ATP-dependent DNA helicase [Frankliniella fusca]|uniref:ATP-dependent DNA helicase n=1 Tax=Frankliniella fusca TaxID=407009 RepID=A0AAE1H6I6_9NEOP|nr:ATP-dependent DNA helicase [Frankliniella fusca]
MIFSKIGDIEVLAVVDLGNSCSNAQANSSKILLVLNQNDSAVSIDKTEDDVPLLVKLHLHLKPLPPPPQTHLQQNLKVAPRTVCSTSRQSKNMIFSKIGDIEVLAVVDLGNSCSNAQANSSKILLVLNQNDSAVSIDKTEDDVPLKSSPPLCGTSQGVSVSRQSHATTSPQSPPLSNLWLQLPKEINQDNKAMRYPDCVVESIINIINGYDQQNRASSSSDVSPLLLTSSIVRDKLKRVLHSHRTLKSKKGLKSSITENEKATHSESESEESKEHGEHVAKKPKLD